MRGLSHQGSRADAERVFCMKPSDYERLLIVGTVCLCTVIIVGGGVAGLLSGLIPLSALGSESGHTSATGLVAFLLIMSGVLAIALRRAK